MPENSASLLRQTQALRAAAMTLLRKLDQVEKDTRGIFVMAHIHGSDYKGANWSEEYKALEAALAQPPESAEVAVPVADARLLRQLLINALHIIDLHVSPQDKRGWANTLAKIRSVLEYPAKDAVQQHQESGE